MISDHAADMEILDDDRLVLTDESSRELVQMIAAPIGDPRVHTSKSQPRLRMVGRPRPSPRQYALCLEQPPPVGSFMPGVAHLLPSGRGDEGGDAGVQPDRLLRRLQRFDCSRSRPLTGLEPRMPRPLGQVVAESRLQVAQGLLRGHAGDIVQEREFRVALPVRQRRGRIPVRHRAAVAARSDACLQGHVVDQTNTAEGAAQMLSLFRGRVEAVTKRPANALSHQANTIRACDQGAGILSFALLRSRPDTATRRFRTARPTTGP